MKTFLISLDIDYSWGWRVGVQAIDIKLLEAKGAGVGSSFPPLRET